MKKQIILSKILKQHAEYHNAKTDRIFIYTRKPYDRRKAQLALAAAKRAQLTSINAGGGSGDTGDIPEGGENSPNRNGPPAPPTPNPTLPADYIPPARAAPIPAELLTERNLELLRNLHEQSVGGANSANDDRANNQNFGTNATPADDTISLGLEDWQSLKSLQHNASLKSLGTPSNPNAIGGILDNPSANSVNFADNRSVLSFGTEAFHSPLQSMVDHSDVNDMFDESEKIARMKRGYAGAPERMGI